MCKLTDNFSLANEYVVEAMNHDGKFAVIGKVICGKNLLGDDELEDIWDFANWAVNGKTQYVVEQELQVYSGCQAMRNEDMIYIIMGGNGIVNDNIMVRKHYDTKYGYYLLSSRIHKTQNRDIWSYGTREEIMSEYQMNPFICG